MEKCNETISDVLKTPGLFVPWKFVIQLPPLALVVLLESDTQFAWVTEKRAYSMFAIVLVGFVALAKWLFTKRPIPGRELMLRDIEKWENQVNQQFYDIVTTVNAQKAIDEFKTDPELIREETLRIYEKYVKPYKKLYIECKLYSAIIKILNLLDEYGDEPSVVETEAHAEYEKKQSKTNKYEVWRKISLLEHTENVINAMVDMKSKNNDGGQILIGVNVLCALGHDIGKLSSLRDGNKDYKTSQHPIKSKCYLDAAIPDDAPSKKNILKAVENHHQKTSDKLTQQLQQADWKAREKELRQQQPEPVDEKEVIQIYHPEGDEPIQKTQKEQKEKPVKKPQFKKVDTSWFDREAYMKKIAQHINTMTCGEYEAIAINDIVYVKISLITKLIKDAFIEHNRFETTEIDDKEKQKSYQFAVRTLLADIVDEHIKKDFIGQKYVIVRENNHQTKPIFCMPLKLSAFSMNTQKRAYELIKTDAYLHAIKEIQAMPTGKKQA